MQIKEAEIFSFGKLMNKKIIFAPGINVIYGANQAGKNNAARFFDCDAVWYGKGQRQGKRGSGYTAVMSRGMRPPITAARSGLRSADVRFIWNGISITEKRGTFCEMRRTARSFRLPTAILPCCLAAYIRRPLQIPLIFHSRERRRERKLRIRWQKSIGCG